MTPLQEKRLIKVLEDVSDSLKRIANQLESINIRKVVEFDERSLQPGTSDCGPGISGKELDEESHGDE